MKNPPREFFTHYRCRAVVLGDLVFDENILETLFLRYKSIS